MIAFLFSPLARIAGVALVIMGAIGWVYSKGAANERGKCEAAALRAELASVRRDLDASHDAAARAAGQALELADAERINKELADEIAILPDTCRADDDHVRRLLRIK